MHYGDLMMMVCHVFNDYTIDLHILNLI